VADGGRSTLSLKEKSFVRDENRGLLLDLGHRSFVGSWTETRIGVFCWVLDRGLLLDIGQRSCVGS
jgi:hypothetical protein